MARTLEQIVAELNPTYQPQVQSLQERASLLPGQIKAEESGLEAKQQESFTGIMDAARRRGLGFSGIPVGEQAKYTATEYLPALARLRQTGREQAMSIQDAINQINERRDTIAQQLRQQELDREESARQAAAARAAASSSWAPSLGGFDFGGSSNAPAQANGPRYVQDGSNAQFLDANNKPITMGQYARATGKDIRDVLYEVGSNGNQRAAALYNQLRIYGNNTNALNNAIRQLSGAGLGYVFNGYVTGGPFAPVSSSNAIRPSSPVATSRTSTGIQTLGPMVGR